jgi:hypothetical protein
VRILPFLHGPFIMICVVIHAAFDIFKRETLYSSTFYQKVVVLTFYLVPFEVKVTKESQL